MSRPLPDEVAADVRAAILAGHKIQAIKLYRNATGVGLKEAKDFIEAVEAELRQTDPESFAPQTKKGCAGMVIAIALLLAIAAHCTAKVCEKDKNLIAAIEGETMTFRQVE
jgi:hypothetical protein